MPLMRQILLRVGLAALTVVLAASTSVAEPLRIPLDAGWAIQASASVKLQGEAISRPGFQAQGWHAATVPGTIVGALVESGRYPDPYTAMNLRAIPGTTYPIGEQFALLPMPSDSPYSVSWWYRRGIDLPAATRDRAVLLDLHRVNYPPDILGNGGRITTDGR